MEKQVKAPAIIAPCNKGYIRESKAVIGTLQREILIMFKTPWRGGWGYKSENIP